MVVLPPAPNDPVTLAAVFQERLDKDKEERKREQLQQQAELTAAIKESIDSIALAAKEAQ